MRRYWVYIFSDGYADPFGGENGKKFKTGQLKSFLMEIATNNGVEQDSLIEERFNSWKGE